MEQLQFCPPLNRGPIPASGSSSATRKEWHSSTSRPEATLGNPATYAHGPVLVHQRLLVGASGTAAARAKRGHSGYPKKLGWVIRVLRNLGFQKRYPMLSQNSITRIFKYPIFQIRFQVIPVIPKIILGNGEVYFCISGSH